MLVPEEEMRELVVERCVSHFNRGYFFLSTDMEPSRNFNHYFGVHFV